MNNSKIIEAIASSQDGNPVESIRSYAENEEGFHVEENLNKLLGDAIKVHGDNRDSLHMDLKYAAAQLMRAAESI